MSAETLALLREGAVSAKEAANIKGHLAACPQCSAVDAQLADLPGLLGSTPAPPMPPSVLGRIQMAIAQESAARGAAGLAVTADAARVSDHEGVRRQAARHEQVPGRPDLPTRRRWRYPRFGMPDWSSPLVLRGLGAAAVVVLIVGGGIMLANSRTASPTPASGSFSGSSTSRQGAHAGPARGAVAQRQVGVNYRLRGRVETTTAVVTNANYTRRSLPGEVRRDVASFPPMSNGAAASAVPEASAPATSLRGTFQMSHMASCLSAVDAGRMVVVTEVARYLGTPAAIIIMRAGNPRIFDVVVAGVACSASNPDIIATLIVSAD